MVWYFFKASKWTLLAMGLISLVAITLFYNLLNPKKILPVYNPVDVNPKLVDASMRKVRKSHQIGAFSLWDQHGNSLTQKDFKDKIYVADFFFTTCPSICPMMTKNMRLLQSYFKSNPSVMFLSHSVTPLRDSIPVLASYAAKNKVNYSRWRLATGRKPHIYDLARKHYFVALDEGDGGVQDFIHTEQFVLVDKKKRIRGYYDGTDLKAMEQLKSDIEALLDE